MKLRFKTPRISFFLYVVGDPRAIFVPKNVVLGMRRSLCESGHFLVCCKKFMHLYQNHNLLNRLSPLHSLQLYKNFCVEFLIYSSGM